MDVELLLDPGELHELLGELVGIQRIQRILVLQLRGQQLQERREVSGDLLEASALVPLESEESAGSVVLPATTEGTVGRMAVAMSVS